MFSPMNKSSTRRAFCGFALSRAVVIDVYDILQSKEDKATVLIYYEVRLAKIDLKPEERPKIDPNFGEGASRIGIRRRGGIHQGKSAPGNWLDVITFVITLAA